MDKLYEDARIELGKQVSRTGSQQRFFVFNPLSWARTDYADIPFKYNFKPRVIDVSTGLEVPSQVLHFGSQKILRILAENVPSAGYKVFEISPGAPANLSDAAPLTQCSRKRFYR